MPLHAVAPLTPYLSMAAIAFIYYRRIRGSFGRQPWRPVRAGARAGLLGVATAALAFGAYALPQLAAGVVLGATIGAALGLLALRHTHAEWRDGQGSYTPNPWIGGALMLVLLGRLAWRWADGAFSTGAATPGPQFSPLTLGIAATLVAYSLVQLAGLWLRMRQLRRCASAQDASALPR